MSTPRYVKVARLGERAVDIATHENMTIGEVINAAGHDDFAGTIHAKKSGDADVTTVADHDSVNGYDELFLTTNVKGG